MRITRLDSHLLRIPLARPVTLPSGGDRGLDHVWLLVVYLDTDAGHRGLGFAYALGGGGRALKVVADDELTPLVVGEDPLCHERLGKKVQDRLHGIGRLGLVAQAYAAIDLALWDLKGKAAGLPLYKLLGGYRDAAPAYAADAGWLWMSPEEMIEAARPHLDQGLMGVKLQVGGDPEADAERVTRVREALGEDVWLGADAGQRYDYATALAMGRFLEEEIGADWFEEPISCEDLEGHARLAQRLEVPVAAGGSLFGPDEFAAYLARDALEVVRPDVTRVGGLTAWLKVAALAQSRHRPVAPHRLPEVGVHLACGLPGVRAVEYLPWLFPAFAEPPAVVNGQLVPPRRPGLGLKLRADALEKYRVAV
jgi:L-alanine-DL-glutamate epimerase-like enolase superfamily enzyme